MSIEYYARSCCTLGNYGGELSIWMANDWPSDETDWKDCVPNITKFCVDEEGLLLFTVLLEVDGDGEPATTELCVDEEGLLLVPVLLEVDGDGVSTTDDGWSSLDGDGEVGNDADDGLGDEQGSTHKHMALG